MKKLILLLSLLAFAWSCDERQDPDLPVTLPVGMHYVDLGLPSGVKWAKCNIGAIRPQESGYRFMWGIPTGYELTNISGKDTKTGDVKVASVYEGAGELLSDGFNYHNFYTGGGESMFYITPESGRDAARNLLGNNWRLPTQQEFEELLDPNNTESKWVENYDNTGVNGMLFTSVKADYKEPLFIPAAGVISGNTLSGENNSGAYWASTGLGSTYMFMNDEFYMLEFYFGQIGNSIRAVYSENPTEGIKGIKLNKSSVRMVVGDKMTLYADVLTEANAVNTKVLWESTDESIVEMYPNGMIEARSEGTVTITAKTMFGGYSATCEVSVYNGNNGHEYVDLGLPSGLKWSIMNVGAESQSSLGDFYAWGATRVDTDYSWESYRWSALSNTALIKYNTKSSYGRDVDNKTVLESSDDVASVDWGSSWRIPTEDEWKELIDNCTWTWTKIEGVTGYKVQSKSEGYTDKWIFLPASGQCVEYWPDYVGSNGYYWSSSLNVDSPDEAFAVEFNNSDKSISRQNRCSGLTVRPVFK